ncbi:MAG TPA: hypothetical protein VEN81_05465, partial [Planctomycetota bacterium]|nr:hypothetical protein [Planctomycetota bacterium]
MDQPEAPRSRKTVLYVSLAVVVVIVVLLLLRSCRKPIEPAFNYFLAKATELGQDPARVGRFVNDEMATLRYHGDVKGPLGALWNGAGSPEEKKKLLETLLKFCKGGGAPPPGGVDPQASVFTLTITHRGRAETKVYEGPIGDCVGDVHSIEILDRGRTRITLRAKEPVTREVETTGATSEEIVFQVQRPGADPMTEVRELWHGENRTGRRSPVAGDRHDFVVLPCRVTSYVREKEELLLKTRGRENAPEAKGYLALLDYARRSDLLLGRLEKNLGVRAQYDLPRILVLSKFGMGERDAFALDLRLDRTTFDGAASAAYLACEERSFLESGLEQHYLEEWSGLPSTSTFDLFSRLRDDYPNKSDRRIVLVAQAARTILETGGLDARVTFRALGPGKDPKPLATAVLSRDRSGGLRLKGGPVKAEFAARLAATKDAPKIPYQGTAIDAPMASVDDAAVAVETTLLAADAKPSVPVDYVLDLRIDRGQEPLVAPGSVFEFTWGSGESRTDQRIVVDECGGDLAFRWRVQTGVRPAVGQRA